MLALAMVKGAPAFVLASVVSIVAACTNRAGDEPAPSDDAGEASRKDAGVSFQPACVSTLADYCAPAVPFACGTWADIKPMTCAGAPCGTYDIFRWPGLDDWNDYYYDHATGVLVAVIRDQVAANSSVCVAGPQVLPAGIPNASCPVYSSFYGCVTPDGGDAASDASPD